jgi:DNA-directed RNA polymerase specialized sigma24 family protein
MNAQEYGYKYANSGYQRTVRVLARRGLAIDRARDLAQSAWTLGLQHLGSLKDDGRIDFWIDTIASNQWCSSIRRDARFDSLEGHAEPARDFPLNADVLDVRRVLSGLNSRQRRLLVGFHIEGRSCGELAEEEKSSAAAIYWALKRARVAFRESYSMHHTKRRPE